MTTCALPLAPADKAAADVHCSYSAVSTYQTCPLRYGFRYVQRLPEETVSAGLVLGSSLHAAVQFWFEQLLAGQPAPTLDVLLDVFQHAWHQHEGRTIQFAKGEDVNTMGRLADRMLRVFRESDFAHPQGNILGVEEQLRGELIPGLPDLLARVDLIVEEADGLIVSDFKSSRSSWTEEHVAESAGQLLLYHELARTLADDKPVRLQFAVLSKAKSPELTLHDVPADPRQIDRTKRIVERVWQAIQAGLFYPSPSPLNCSSCPFREPCRAWTG